MAKIRNGFVTNSSSSSYIIAYKPSIFDVDEEAKKNLFVSFGVKYVKAMFMEDEDGSFIGYRNGKVETKEELDDNYGGLYYGDYYSIEDLMQILEEEDDDFGIKAYQRCSDLIDAGYKILFRYIDYEKSDVFNLLVKSLSESNSDDIITIYGENE